MYFIAFLIMAGCLVQAAVQTPWLGLRILLTYSAFGMCMMSLVYLFGKPLWLQKRQIGIRRIVAWPLFGPFFILNGLLFQLTRLTSRETPVDEILPNLLLGRLLNQKEAVKYCPSPAAVIDLTCEFSEASPLRRSPGYLALPTLDGTTPSAEDIQLGVEHIKLHIEHAPVFVHCALGHGRSATVVAAFLLSTGHAKGLREAIDIIQANRPGIGLKASQVNMLRRLFPENR